MDRTDKGVALMPLRKLFFLSGLVLAVVAMTPAAAMGAANGTDRPLMITGTSTTTVNLVTGAGSTVGSGQASLLGKFTSNTDDQYVLVGSNGFSWTGTGTIVAANGDKLFTSVSGTGTFGTPIRTEGVTTITGGTGRFADATGTLTGSSATTSVSVVGSIETTTQSGTSEGTISY